MNSRSVVLTPRVRMSEPYRLSDISDSTLRYVRVSEKTSSDDSDSSDKAKRLAMTMAKGDVRTRSVPHGEDSESGYGIPGAHR